ncbi:MAG: hypothetical protein AAGI46_05985 [Planctomycetota bacterium]
MKRSRTRLLLALLLLVCGCVSTRTTSPDGGQSREIGTRALSAVLVQDALDREALFTIAGGLKPVSSGFWQGKIDLASPSVDELTRIRRGLEPLRSGDLYADVQVFATADDGERYLDAYVVHRPSLAQMIERTQPFWARYGIAPDTHPAELLAVVDRMPRLDRFRGYGLLFGYPEEAIDFFVDAAAEEERTGEFVERRFMQIPTFDSPTGQFTYAVPIKHRETEADRRLRERAGEILSRYRQLRDPARPLKTLEAMTR